MDTVGMNSQTYVLDNRHPLPMEYDLLPYEWHKLQIAGTQTWEWAQDADKTIS
jgi:predicted transglutaminase-like cysteine proteinase